jgi:hypothetical protein
MQILVSQKTTTTKVANYKPGVIATHRGFHIHFQVPSIKEKLCLA